MEDLPYEIVCYIFSFLSIDDRFRLRRVSRSMKIITELHMINVKRVSSRRRKVYSPLHAGCSFSEQEFCAAACRPECLLLILKYCQKIECLFIGKIPVENEHLIGKIYQWESPNIQTPQPRNPCHIDMGELYSVIFNDDVQGVWTESALKTAFELMAEMDSLKCLSWIGLETALPDALIHRITHIFCPIMFLGFGMRRSGDQGVTGRQWRNCLSIIEKEVTPGNLHQPDYSDVIFIGDRCWFIERHSCMRLDDYYIYSMNVRCPAGETAFPVELVFRDDEWINVKVVKDVVVPADSVTLGIPIETFSKIWKRDPAKRHRQLLIVDYSKDVEKQ